MDNRGTCRLKEKKMDANKVWQWRIMRVKKYSRRPEPFYHSNKIGLDYNVASNTQKKLDLDVVTNGVILEVCDFAKMINKSKRHFITNILGNNFDLGLENEQQRMDFTSHIFHKIKELIRKPPKDKNDVFTLFDTPSKHKCDSNNAPNTASTQCRTECVLVDMDDTDDSEYEAEVKPSQATSKEYIKTESLSDEMDGAHGDDSEDEEELESPGAQSVENVLPLSFPHCEKIGLNLKVMSKQSLDPGLLTKGVMLELVHFTRILTASYSPIVLGVLEHNFELDLKSQQDKNRVWFKISQLLRRRKRLITTGSKITPEFKNEQFSFQTNPFKRTGRSVMSNTEAPIYQFKEVAKRTQTDLKTKKKKRALVSTNERADKRRRRGQSKDMEKNTLSHHTDQCTSQIVEGDHCHTCPLGESDFDSDPSSECDMGKEEMGNENDICTLGESDLDTDNRCGQEEIGTGKRHSDVSDIVSNKVTNSGNASHQDHLQNPKSSDIPGKSESSCLGIHAPFLTYTDLSYILLADSNSNVKPPFASQPNTPNECDMEQEDIEPTEKNMWKLRSNRVKQILSAVEFNPFHRSRNFGLDFNVGFGPKQKISVDSLPNSVLLEVAKFALAMSSSQQHFIMEILEYNFDFGLQSQHQRNILTCEVMNRVRKLRSEGAVKVSKKVSELPRPVPKINMGNQSSNIVSAELGSTSRMEQSDVAPLCPSHLHAETNEHVSGSSVDLYPFCKEIGMKLHVNKHKPNQKLDMKKLTNGVMTEVTNLAEKLCGTFEQICLDILEHNLDLDLQRGDGDLARSIVARIPAIVLQNDLTTCARAYRFLKKRGRITTAQQACHNSQNSDSASSSQAAITDQDIGNSPDFEHQNEVNLRLWKLRANQIQQILSVPHEEHCPLYSYSRCRKLGIDFNVGSGVKQNLDPKLLTNGIMVELNTFATAMQSAQKYFLTEILEYNFPLNFNTELHRSTFAYQTMEKTRIMMANKKWKHRHLKRPFELPDTRCIQETPYEKSTHCPKCYQDRNQKVCQEEFNPGHTHHPHPYTMTGTVTAETKCTAQKPANDPSFSLSPIDEMIMDSFPLCKKIGLKLCVDKDKPNDKFEMHVLTVEIMNEVAFFAKRLCASSKTAIIHAVLEHNFNIGVEQQHVDIVLLFRRALAQRYGGLAWFSEDFVILPVSRRPPVHESKVKQKAAMQRSERMKRIKKSKLALQTKEKGATLPSQNISVLNSKTNSLHKGNRYPICTENSLDLDVTSKSEEKRKLDLKVLTRAACDMEQEETGTENDYTCPLGESDLDSDSATDSENVSNQNHLQILKSCSLSSDAPRDSESSCLGIHTPFRNTTGDSSSLPAVTSNVNLLFASHPDERGLCGEEEQTQTPINAPHEFDIEQEDIEPSQKNMWKLRASRVKQILSAVEFSPFYRSRNFGLDFNVGFGQKQKIRVDSLPNSVLLEVARFALAMNSSRQHFIMEILEYNFDISLQSADHRNIFAFEIIKRSSHLKDCKDAVKNSQQVFKLPGSMAFTNIENQSSNIVSAELGSISRMEQSDVAPVCPSHLHAETNEHVSGSSVDLYPLCKEIGMKLHVDKHKPNQKLDMNKLTNGVMTEVTNLAEKLCGTFEQICLDILEHNLDLDLQRGDGDLARSIVARIPAIVLQNDLTTCARAYRFLKRKVDSRRGPITKALLSCHNNQNSDACSATSSQAAITDQDIGNSPDIEHQNEVNLRLWKLRANQIQQILSVPHEEHCPLYSYSRCRKLDIDFNVGSGVKQNLDPKLLTNGIMAELNNFATAMLSAQKYFLTEILEYNFPLNFNTELHRTAFAYQTMEKTRVMIANKKWKHRHLKRPFELPDTRCIQDTPYEKSTHCPKCYQDRNQKVCQDEFNPGHTHHPHPYTMTGTVTAETKCTAQKPANDPSFSSSPIDEMIMDSFPLCKKIGLKLCVDKDKPKDKFEMHVLTVEIMNEVADFAKRLCASSKTEIIHAVLEHNFNIGVEQQHVDIALLFRRMVAQREGGLAWFSEDFVIQPVSQRPPGYVGKVKKAAAMQRSERMETIKKRKLALQTKVEKATLLSQNSHLLKSKTLSKGYFYPICTEIGLDLDVTNLREKGKLDLKLLTRAVVFEIHKFASQKKGCHLQQTLYDILDYNFDLSSQHHRRWEFSIATLFKVQNMAKRYRKRQDIRDKVFKLPFVSPPKASQKLLKKKQYGTRKMYSHDEADKKMNEGYFVRQARYHSDVSTIYILDGVQTNEETCFHDEDTKFPTDPGRIVQMNASQLRIGCASLLQGNLQIKKEEYDPHYINIKQEPDIEELYYPHDGIKTASNTDGVAEHFIQGEPSGSLGYTLMTLWPNSESLKTESENVNVQYHILAEPQGAAVSPNTASNIKTEWDTEGVNYLDPAEAAASQGYSIVTVGQDNQSPLIKEEQDSVPPDSYYYG